MKKTEMPLVIPFFVNSKNESLSLSEILKTNIITSITIGYLSEKKRVDASGFAGFLGFKKTIRDKKEITFNDLKGINFHFFEGVELAKIDFSDVGEYVKLVDFEFDVDTIHKKFWRANSKPYQICFHVNNIKKIDWI